MGAIDGGEGSQLTPADEQLLGPNIPKYMQVLFYDQVKLFIAVIGQLATNIHFAHIDNVLASYVQWTLLPYGRHF